MGEAEIKIFTNPDYQDASFYFIEYPICDIQIYFF